MRRGEVCIHKSLKRQCETCEIADERDLWKQKAAKLAEALKKISEADSDLSNETNAYYEAWKICTHTAEEALANYEKGKINP